MEEKNIKNNRSITLLILGIVTVLCYIVFTAFLIFNYIDFASAISADGANGVELVFFIVIVLIILGIGIYLATAILALVGLIIAYRRKKLGKGSKREIIYFSIMIALPIITEIIFINLFNALA